MRVSLVSFVFALSLLCSPWLAAESTAPATVSITEWPVPWPDTRPRDPYLAPDGKVWFVGQGGDYAAWFDPKTERFGKLDLASGTGPHNIIVDADGNGWYAGNRNAHIGRIDANTQEIVQLPTPAPEAKDPHTLHYADGGTIWFTAQWGNHIGQLNIEDGSVRTLGLNTDRARPYGIKLDADGNAWVALLGTNQLARVDVNDFSLEEIDLPRSEARPRRIAITGGHDIWYVDYNQGYLGRYNANSQTFSEWRAPGKDKSGPYAVAADRYGRVWFVETWQQPNRLVGFDPDSEQFFSTTDIPSGGGTVRHMYYDADSHSLWFGTDTNQLGQARLPEP